MEFKNWKKKNKRIDKIFWKSTKFILIQYKSKNISQQFYNLENIYVITILNHKKSIILFTKTSLLISLFKKDKH